MFIEWLLMAVASLALNVVNLFAAPFMVLTAQQNEKGEWWLPAWLSWFQTPDNPLDGDVGWRRDDRPFKTERNAFERWVNHVLWLYRNPCYGFDLYVLGALVLPSDCIEQTGSAEVSNRPHLQEGWYFKRVVRAGAAIYWQFYFVKAWSSENCLRVNLGWKLWSAEPNKPTICQLVISANPLSRSIRRVPSPTRRTLATKSLRIF